MSAMSNDEKKKQARNKLKVDDTIYIGGLQNIRQKLSEMIEYPIKYPNIYAKYNQTPARGCLLWGPPGCGKTLIAKAIASQCSANFISIKGPQLLTQWFGESEANIRNIFAKARQSSPCILFFDELDSIARVRGSFKGDSGATDRIMNQLLTEMDGINKKKHVFVIGATNRPQLIDPALLRPGRLDEMIFIDLPDFAERISILKATLHKSPIHPSIDFQYIAQQTKGYSGADLHAITKFATNEAIKLSIAVQIDMQKKIKSGTLNKKDADKYLKENDKSIITKDIMINALKQSKKSVSNNEYLKYLQMKKHFDKESGD